MSNNSFKKPFNPDLYKENDTKAKEASKSFYKLIPEYKGLHIAENILTPYGPDMMLLKRDKDEHSKDRFTVTSYLELEIKQVWDNAGAFKWTTIHIPDRKLKMLGNCAWLIFRADMQAAMYIPAAVMDSSKIIYKESKYSKGELEGFLEVDMSKARFIELDDI